ncbi:uncharacterized protein BDR25DRAFT_360390 [Lindgomyces ingoldianus]|uniref:Uncharacterized protein n=1 Tax=Lindgomyces ingoldianus TaxID=673940 RepID=A0ACB6QH45_9PLEO|nr:uncharacterized protein BDR25DRAFT_360390 [Lindgomyces ingoldianus]KAF2465427.1 hypothetical protein BDR25DRAFT_360390 [Lindgomyces ingoldianus]
MSFNSKGLAASCSLPLHEPFGEVVLVVHGTITAKLATCLDFSSVSGSAWYGSGRSTNCPFYNHTKSRLLQTLPPFIQLSKTINWYILSKHKETSYENSNIDSNLPIVSQIHSTAIIPNGLSTKRQPYSPCAFADCIFKALPIHIIHRSICGYQCHNPASLTLRDFSWLKSI